MQDRDRLQIPFLILGGFKRLNQLLFPLKSSENQRFSDDVRGNRSLSDPREYSVILIKSEIWRPSLRSQKTRLMS